MYSSCFSVAEFTWISNVPKFPVGFEGTSPGQMSWTTCQSSAWRQEGNPRQKPHQPGPTPQPTGREKGSWSSLTRSPGLWEGLQGWGRSGVKPGSQSASYPQGPQLGPGWRPAEPKQRTIWRCSWPGGRCVGGGPSQGWSWPLGAVSASNFNTKQLWVWAFRQAAVKVDQIDCACFCSAVSVEHPTPPLLEWCCAWGM